MKLLALDRPETAMNGSGYFMLSPERYRLVARGWDVTTQSIVRLVAGVYDSALPGYCTNSNYVCVIRDGEENPYAYEFVYPRELIYLDCDGE